MKKFLSLILVLAMVACMNVTAFAADPTTTLTVEVPANLPEYNLHIPADTTLTYGNTEKLVVGELYATDVAGDITYVFCEIKYTDLINTNDPTDTISLELYFFNFDYDDGGDDSLLNKETGREVGWNSCPYLYDGNWQDDCWLSPFRTCILKAQVSDWTGATAGATYKATITYVVYTE